MPLHNNRLPRLASSLSTIPWTTISSHILPSQTLQNKPFCRFSTSAPIASNTDPPLVLNIKTQPPSTPSLPHLTPTSEIHIVPITSKPRTHRLATAVGHVTFSNPSPYHLIKENAMRKGDVLAVARIAGVMAAKKTSEWIPLCHNGVGLESVRVRVELVPGGEEGSLHGSTESSSGPRESLDKTLSEPIGSFGGIRIEAQVECEGKTGVEMEALTAVAGAGLTVVDMCKGVDRGLRMEGMRVVRKEGGRSGAWRVEG